MRKSLRRKIFYSAILLLFLSSLLYLGPSLEKITLRLLKIPLKALNFLSQESYRIFNYKSYYKENLKLKKTIALLKERLLSCEEILKENERLRSLLNFKKRSSLSLIPAQVIGHDPERLYSSIIINKGLDEGVREGLVVIKERGLVGRVVESQAHISKVMLLNDLNFSVAARLRRSREEVLVKGRLLKNCKLTYFKGNIDIKVGDIVITSGLAGIFPEGIVIGEVISLFKDSKGRILYGILKPKVDLFSLEEVLIIIR